MNRAVGYGIYFIRGEYMRWGLVRKVEVVDKELREWTSILPVVNDRVL